MIINQELEFKLTDLGEINNKNLNDFKLSLNKFLSKNDYPFFDTFLVKGFEYKKIGRNGNSLLLEFEEVLEELINRVKY
ncbi:MAG: hypothetical protein ACFFBH_07620 [Promethearchaeota archaeon]